ncbi:DUF4276 family protein [Amycolatopsis sp. H20-H5]|uniref:DUF4276 family protein n=1 Tax=Amycolatopsis sp. H20-H5 TaxID=3046309 RepID=UPI002DC0289E|nr:DUF4276 family protein [Amycolatopsis sp. H20-H5]MEC3981074.1 DUF4276 family protein [Amycolatopsis sp. H20-H5]
MTERRRLHLLVEGQTEATVVRETMLDHFQAEGWLVTWSMIRTQRSTGAHRGGVSSWAKIHRDVKELLGGKNLHVLTTLFDYYGFPEDAPGMPTRPAGSAHDQVAHVEQALAATVGDRRFLPHLVLHELETWVFAAADQLAELRGEPELANRLKADCLAAGGAELVNNGPKTAPSKRLTSYCGDYLKTVDGPLAINDLGIKALKKQCPHFAAWLDELSSR